MSRSKHQAQIRRNSKRHSSDKGTFGFEAASKPNTSAPSEDIVARSVRRSCLPYDSFVRLIIQSALSRLTIWTQADLERLLLTAERLGLDPLSNEIYAIEKPALACKKAQIIFVVGVDGWTKIINSHPAFDGMKFVESEPGDDELPLYFECTIFRKDRKVATTVREYMYEVHTNQGAWLTHPRRMLRHKAMVQCARVCFGLSGIYDPDESFRVSQTHETHIALDSNKAGTSSTPAKHSPSGDKTLGSQFVKTWISKFPDGVRASTSSSPESVDTHQVL
jgi:phage recombination protein Bet